MEHFSIRPLAEEEISPALELAWRVFLEYEAPEYSPEGVEEFRRYIQPRSVGEMRAKGALLIWGCLEGERVVGMLGLRPPGHISLLFVDPGYHRRGIAKRLMEAMEAHVSAAGGADTLTVNSSPYAVEIYAKMGFVPTAEEQLQNGIRYTPMEKKLR